MGCWGYKEIESDNGLDRMAGAPSFLSWAMDNQNILDVDRALKDSAARYKSDYFYKGSEIYQIEYDRFAMSEILYHFINNNIISGLGRLNINDSYGWANVTKVIASKEIIKYLVESISTYLNGSMKSFKTSGWFREKVYRNRYNWIKGIGQALIKAANQSTSNPVIIYDKSTAKPELFIYKHSIKMTQNHEFNRLRLFVKNDINYQYEYMNNRPYNQNKVYSEVVIRKDTRGNSFYALIHHNKEGRQSTVAKGKTSDELIQNAIKSQKEGSLSDFEWYIWNLCYNRNMYNMYCSYLAQYK